MTSTPKPTFSVSEALWRFFVSLRVTILLLVLWLALSVVGTLIPQNAEPARYVELYGTDLANWILRLNFIDVYHSSAYSLVLLLLVLNLVACTLNTLPSKLALARRPKGELRPISGTGKRYVTLSLRGKKGAADLDAFKSALAARYKVESFTSDTAQALFAERQVFSHFMVYVIHLGLVVIILGGLVTSLLGFEGSLQIPEGQARDRAYAQVGNDEEGRPLGFTLKLEKFRFERFKNGMPKTYASTLTVIEGGKSLFARTIEVNTPLNYGGYNFYQSSYSEAAPIRVSAPDGKETREMALAEGEVTELMLGGQKLLLRLDSYFDMGRARRAELSYQTAKGEEGHLSISGKPEQDAAAQADQPLRASFYKDGAAYVSGILVSSDPGVWLVWLGSGIFMAGLYLTFYSAHRRLTVVRQGSELLVCGLTSRNPTGFSRELLGLAQKAGLDAACKSPNEA